MLDHWESSPRDSRDFFHERTDEEVGEGGVWIIQEVSEEDLIPTLRGHMDRVGGLEFGSEAARYMRFCGLEILDHLLFLLMRC